MTDVLKNKFFQFSFNDWRSQESATLIIGENEYNIPSEDSEEVEKFVDVLCCWFKVNTDELLKMIKTYCIKNNSHIRSLHWKPYGLAHEYVVEIKNNKVVYHVAY